LLLTPGTATIPPPLPTKGVVRPADQPENFGPCYQTPPSTSKERVDAYALTCEDAARYDFVTST
ncbi:MAG TPA: hypothetical protein VJ818_00525, partial [Actinomycetota bacterium]|nr:hypothetical protein [Actinomycetota bacterium]